MLKKQRLASTCRSAVSLHSRIQSVPGGVEVFLLLFKTVLGFSESRVLLVPFLDLVTLVLTLFTLLSLESSASALTRGRCSQSLFLRTTKLSIGLIELALVASILIDKIGGCCLVVHCVCARGGRLRPPQARLTDGCVLRVPTSTGTWAPTSGASRHLAERHMYPPSMSAAPSQQFRSATRQYLDPLPGNHVFASGMWLST